MVDEVQNLPGGIAPFGIIVCGVLKIDMQLNYSMCYVYFERSN